MYNREIGDQQIFDDKWIERLSRNILSLSGVGVTRITRMILTVILPPSEYHYHHYDSYYTVSLP